MSFDWSSARNALHGFGGELITLNVPKTGMPFFDALQLYGAIDLYVGLREDVTIQDEGNRWSVSARSRPERLKERDQKAFSQVWRNKKPNPREYCGGIRRVLLSDGTFMDSNFVDGRGEWDSALQDGIRGVSAGAYETLQSGQTSKKECKAQIPLSQAVLAFSGQRRIEGVGDIRFLPVFEGRIDLSKVVCPVRAWLRAPNVLFAQLLMLLSLKTSLFAEGYEKALRGVVFNTNFDSRKRDNYSGTITIESTAVGKIASSAFARELHEVFGELVEKSWDRGGSTRFYPAALAMAYWLAQPVSSNLSGMITSQEMLRREGQSHILPLVEYAKEVFVMTYENWKGDHEAVRRFAKAVASGIQWARGRDSRGNWLPPAEQRRNWYDEVTLLRSAPSVRAFRERALILIEQGHREHSGVGTIHRDEAFDPKALLASIGDDRGSAFEAFRDLFRMYLIQASTYESKDVPAAGASTDLTDETNPSVGEEASP